MWNADVLVLVFGAFLCAGFVKGVVGFGIPVVSLAVLVPALGLKTAIGLIVIPAIVVNVWQAFAGGKFGEIVARIWPMLILGSLFIWVGVGLLAGADALLATMLLGIFLAGYAGYSLARAQLSPPRAWEPWLTPVVGVFSGIVFGYTGSLMVPAVIYLQSLGLGRDMLVQALGIHFLLMTLALGVSLTSHSLMSAELALLSACTLVPTGLGMAVGQRFRHRVSEELFRTMFFWALLAAGVYMTVRALAA